MRGADESEGKSAEGRVNSKKTGCPFSFKKIFRMGGTNLGEGDVIG